MTVYYGVIYFKDGTKVELGTHSGAGAETAAERHAAQEFDMYMQTAQRTNVLDITL